jgi:mannose-1-phosphate guanylyltransferase
MRALLLAAGFGTRLRPLTDTIPKCLVPVHGKPLIDYWLDLLLGGPVDRVLVNTHYLAEVVRGHIGRSRWRDRIDLVHEDELLGTGGTVLKNAGYFQDKAFLVGHADNLTSFDLDAFIGSHRTRPANVDITMMTFETDAPQSCGIVELDDRGVVIGFHEKVANPPGNHANAAVYIFEPTVLRFLAEQKKSVIDLSTEVLPHFIGRIGTFENAVYHRDIGTLESLAAAEREFNRAWRSRPMESGL